MRPPSSHFFDITDLIIGTVALDGGMIVIAMAVINILHPGRLLRDAFAQVHKSSESLEMSLGRPETSSLLGR